MSVLKYRAFISYSWKDRAEAEALHRALETFRTPKALLAEGAPARLVPVFRDRDEEAAGASLKAAIESALDQSEVLIVVCSPNGAASPWVNKEIAYFRKKRSPDAIFSYVIAGEPGPQCFPPTLLYESSIDGTVTAEPIEAPLAAEARAEGDGPRLARLKIIAAMLKVGLDDLVRRDQQRRVRNLRALLAGASAVAIAMIGVAAYAVTQQRLAEANAERAEREALKASRTAEFMVGLFEVPDPSESRGRKVTAREILDKGVKTIEKDLAAEPDVQATLMHTMGRSYTGLGLYPDAARILEAAVKKRVETKADPADLYASENALARALFEEGDRDAAKKIYTKLVAEAEKDIAAGGWRVDYAVALTGMGETVLYADDAKTAQPHYERARDLLAAHGMSESEEMAEALQGLAGALMFENNWRDAEALYVRAKGVLFKRHGADYFPAAVIDNDLGNLFYFHKEFQKSKEAFQSALVVYRRALGAGHPEVLTTQNNVARIELEMGEIDAAARRLRQTIKQLTLLGRDKDFFFLFPKNNLGEALMELGQIDLAKTEFRDALGLAVDRSNRMFGPINLNLGRAECALNQTREGLRRIEIGRRALPPHYEQPDWRYGVADEFESRCRAAMGETETARALAKSGYERVREQLGDEHYFTQRAKKWMDGLER